MTDDVRAAAERLRRYKSERYTESSAYCMQTSGGPEFNEARFNEDTSTLADAYLNAFPADDGEPVTEAWLRAAGFTVNPLRDRLEVGPAQWWHFANCVLGIDHHTGFWTLPTRGHVRRLCAALGIPLTEAPQ